MPIPRFLFGMVLPSVLAVALLMAQLGAQTATDVGLRFGGTGLSQFWGQTCGPFTCAPIQAGPTVVGQQYNVFVSGAPQQIYILAADLPSGLPCVPFPGIANSLIMLQQPITLAIGVTATGGLTTACYQGRGLYVLQFPTGTPTGVAYLLQGMAISYSQNIPAFTVAITSTTS